MSSEMRDGKPEEVGGAAGLAFIDLQRQHYAEVMRPPGAGVIFVGDYLEEGGTGPLGEFRISLQDLGNARGRLHPQLCVFGDGAASLALLLAVLGPDLSGLLAPVVDHMDMSRRLVGLGLRDRSDTALADGGRDG
jgi:hypothetical protein